MKYVRSLLPVALLCAALPASAVLHTWSGSVNGSWSNAGNWSAGGAPTNGETSVVLVFPNAQGNMGSMNNDVTGLAVTSITFSDTSYVLAGNAIDFTGTISIDNGTLGGEAMVNVPIALTGDATFQVTGNPDYWLGFGGVISGPGNVTIQMASPFSGTPIVSFDAANTYTGTTTVASAYLRVQNAQALGATSAGTIVAPGGTLTLGAVTISGEALSVGGSGQNGNGALQLGSGTWQGPVTLTADTFIRSDTGTIDGAISGAFGIEFAGSPVITLLKPNTYTGTSTIDYGTVLPMSNQPGAVVVSGFSSPSSTLGGKGWVGNVSMGGGPNPKIVDPGIIGGTGIFSTANFSLNDTVNGNHAKLHVDLNGTSVGAQYDQVWAFGTVDVTNATLEVVVGYSAFPGHTFTIVNNFNPGAVAGTFAGLPEGTTFVASGRTLQISYVGGNGNDIVLTVISSTPVELSRFAAE